MPCVIEWIAAPKKLVAISSRSRRWWASQRSPSPMSSRMDDPLERSTAKLPATVSARNAAQRYAPLFAHNGSDAATANSQAPMGAPRKMLPTLSDVVSRLLPRSSWDRVTTCESIARAALS